MDTESRYSSLSPSPKLTVYFPINLVVWFLLDIPIILFIHIPSHPPDPLHVSLPSSDQLFFFLPLFVCLLVASWFMQPGGGTNKRLEGVGGQREVRLTIFPIPHPCSVLIAAVLILEPKQGPSSRIPTQLNSANSISFLHSSAQKVQTASHCCLSLGGSSSSFAPLTLSANYAFIKASSLSH